MRYSDLGEHWNDYQVFSKCSDPQSRGGASCRIVLQIAIYPQYQVAIHHHHQTIDYRIPLIKKIFSETISPVQSSPGLSPLTLFPVDNEVNFYCLEGVGRWGQTTGNSVLWVSSASVQVYEWPDYVELRILILSLKTEARPHLDNIGSFL